MQLILFVSAGGAVGAGLRYLVNEAFAVRGLHAFPWATLTVNVVGSLLMGLLIGMFAVRSIAAPELRAFLTTGILGGFTTFSAFSIDFAKLVEGGEVGAAAAYAAASVALSIAAVFLGLWFARTVFA